MIARMLSQAVALVLMGADLGSVSQAGGQLLWTAPAGAGNISVNTRPVAGGSTRLLGTVPGGGTRTVAFDGTRYVIALSTADTI
jgi:hypothetical protein